LQNYLTNYGYISPGKGAAELMSWREALVDMQSFFGLNETGELDAATLSLMEKPRCGNHDKV